MIHDGTFEIIEMCSDAEPGKGSLLKEIKAKGTSKTLLKKEIGELELKQRNIYNSAMKIQNKIKSITSVQLSRNETRETK